MTIRQVLEELGLEAFRCGADMGSSLSDERITEALTSIASEIEKMKKDTLYINKDTGVEGMGCVSDEHEGYNQAISDVAKLIRGQE